MGGVGQYHCLPTPWGGATFKRTIQSLFENQSHFPSPGSGTLATRQKWLKIKQGAGNQKKKILAPSVLCSLSAGGLESKTSLPLHIFRAYGSPPPTTAPSNGKFGAEEIIPRSKRKAFWLQTRPQQYVIISEIFGDIRDRRDTQKIAFGDDTVVKRRMRTRGLVLIPSVLVDLSCQGPVSNLCSRSPVWGQRQTDGRGGVPTLSTIHNWCTFRTCEGEVSFTVSVLATRNCYCWPGSDFRQ